MGNGPTIGQKWDALNLKKNLVINFHSIYSILKFVFFWGGGGGVNILFLRYRPKPSQPIRL